LNGHRECIVFGAEMNACVLTRQGYPQEPCSREGFSGEFLKDIAHSVRDKYTYYTILSCGCVYLHMSIRKVPHRSVLQKKIQRMLIFVFVDKE
jgi:hypothetical protein